MIEMHEAAMQSQLDYLERWSWRGWEKTDRLSTRFNAYMMAVDKDIQSLKDQMVAIVEKMEKMVKKMEEMVETPAKTTEKPKRGRPKQTNPATLQGGKAQGKGGGKETKRKKPAAAASKEKPTGAEKSTAAGLPGVKKKLK